MTVFDFFKKFIPGIEFNQDSVGNLYIYSVRALSCFRSEAAGRMYYGGLYFNFPQEGSETIPDTDYR